MTLLSERERRWRLLLGGDNQDNASMSAEDMQLDQILNALYGSDDERGADLSSSAPKVARWLGDIRERFPSSVVRVMQKDAFERLNLERMLLEPEMLEAVQPDIHLVANLMSLGHLIPERSKETARQVVRKIVEELMRKLQSNTEQAIRGSLNRAMRKQRPRHADIDWARTIRANLKHYQPEYRTIVPERLIGYGRKQPSALKEVMLCVDQSGSMASSVIYASIFAAVMASISALKTQLVVFDTAVVDLTEKLQDPVDVLFGVQLGGGTDINKAVTYCQQQITKPQDTSFILITDLYEGGDQKQLVQRVAELKHAGVNVITLLALNDDGAPYFDKRLAQQFASLDVPTFACTPDQFPDLMAVALGGGSVADWTASQDIVMERQG
ncbi:VWA domain-containing protein [Hahella sp. KA22]|uniref:VWA domain-containing protein n=1 Tax=Hahella sp. KA22 TaxID=1628392 RepID=UPI000FDEC0F7|nr:VWA domain-containing protein [Hahella sp. KA22]AZZ94104.1 VWA domain-containing protein [Hahella sp. KA22]QAY57478.1 VWA domain-containing protein [Hahella sp. KA22]